MTGESFRLRDVLELDLNEETFELKFHLNQKLFDFCEQSAAPIVEHAKKFYTQIQHEGKIQSYNINLKYLDALWNTLIRLDQVPDCYITIGIGIPRLPQFEIQSSSEGSSHLCELRIVDKSHINNKIYPQWISAYINIYLEKNEIAERCNPAQIEGIVYQLKHRQLDRWSFNIHRAPVQSLHQHREFSLRIIEDFIHLTIYDLQSFAKEFSPQKLFNEIKRFIADKEANICQSVVFYLVLSKRIATLFAEIKDKLLFHQLVSPYTLMIGVPQLKRNDSQAEEIEIVYHTRLLKGTKNNENSILDKNHTKPNSTEIEKSFKNVKYSSFFPNNMVNRDLIYVNHIRPQVLSKTNRRLLELSKNAINIIPPRQRQIHALTLNMTHESLEQVKQHITKLQSALVTIKPGIEGQDLLCIQSQLFPITRRATDSQKIVDNYNETKEWSKTIIRELVTLENFKVDPQWIKSILYPKISVVEIKKVLEFLLKHKIIVKDGNRGKYVPTSKNIMTEQEVQGEAAIRYQHSLINLAIELVERVPSDEYFYYKIMMPINLDSEDFQNLKELILVHLTNIFNVCQTTQKSRRIYQFNLQAFPINIKG